MKTLSLNILDIVQNSVRAKASEIFIGIKESKQEDLFEIVIDDNGSGMTEKMVTRVTDPFVTTRTTRKIGMGLALLKYHANLTGGELLIDSQEGKGTNVIADFSLSHVDRQPLGDIAGVMTILMSANPEIDFLYNHKTDEGEYRFSSKETKEFLRIDNFSEYQLLEDIKEMINQNLNDINASDFKEKNSLFRE
jgi:DNA mismatch repair ATPase MutL